MVYNSNIPQAGDRPSSSQSQLLGNFQDLKTYLDRNHVAISDPGSNVDEGKHNFLQMPEQATAPSTLANEGGVYTKEVSTATQLFFREESDGTERQLTGQFWSQVGGDYGMITPWGLTANWGVVTTTGNTPVTVTFRQAYPSSGAVHSIQVTPISDTGANRTSVVSTGSVTATTFQIRSSNNGMQAYYWAIGSSV